MAGLSNALIAGLARPSYSGMLSSAVGGGFQGIQDAYADRRNRGAVESAQAMLTGADPDDPRIQQSVQAVFSQMNQDPREAQKMIDSARQEKRAAEDQKMQTESHEASMAYNKLRLKQEQENEKDRKAASLAAAAYRKDPAKADAWIDTLPPERQDAARAAVQKVAQYDNSMMQYREEVRNREPLSQEALDQIAKTPGMEQAIATYEKFKKDRPGMAEKRLLDQWAIAYESDIRSTTKPKESKMTKGEIDMYLELIENTRAKEDTRWGITKAWDSAWNNEGPKMSVPNPDMDLAVAKRLAWKARDPDFNPTPETIAQTYREVMAGTPRETDDDNTEDTDKETPKSNIPAEILEVYPDAYEKDGEFFVMINGVENRITVE